MAEYLFCHSDYLNRVATLQQKVISADLFSTQLSIIDIHSSNVKWPIVDCTVISRDIDIDH